ncbi:SDR family oxidoreductase [Arthrobacter sp. SF27]|nr:SDR family oxidoreductase [Arthrobacter sp. SF27]
MLTGAAGGIGRATAHFLAQRGHAVVIADLDVAACRSVASEIRAAGGQSIAVGLDVSDPASVDAAVATAQDLGELKGLVNSAGIVHLGGIRDVSRTDWDRVIGVNLTGTYNLCKAVEPVFTQHGGSIVNVASTAGRTASTFSSPAYVASKAGVIGLTMSLAHQLAPQGVRVNAVAPGIIDTPMIQGYGPERHEKLLAGIPLGRMGSAEEVAHTIGFLISDESSYVTGQTIAINGGTFIS